MKTQRGLWLWGLEAAECPGTLTRLWGVGAVHVRHWQVIWEMLHFKSSGPNKYNLSVSISVQPSNVVTGPLKGAGHNRSLQDNLSEEALRATAGSEHIRSDRILAVGGWDSESCFSTTASRMAGRSLDSHASLSRLSCNASAPHPPEPSQVGHP